MLNFPRLIAATAFGFALLSTPAFAQQPAPQAKPDEAPRHQSRMIQLLDTGGDGTVSLAEIKGELGRLYGATDVDGDGKLSPGEFRRRGFWFRRLGTTTLFDLMDADGNGSLSKAEISAPSERWFKRYDANGDGAIAQEELPRRTRFRRRGPPWRR